MPEYLGTRLVSEPTPALLRCAPSDGYRHPRRVLPQPEGLTGVVKIRKGLAVRLLRDRAAGQDIRKYRWWFAHFAAQMRRTALAVPTQGRRLR